MNKFTTQNDSCLDIDMSQYIVKSREQVSIQSNTTQRHDEYIRCGAGKINDAAKNDDAMHDDVVKRDDAMR
jgi:hypothetical protein